MTIYARITTSDGIVYHAPDCVVTTATSPLSSMFHPEWLAKNPFVVGLDGMVAGCLVIPTFDANGAITGVASYENVVPPPVVVAPPQPTQLDILHAKIDALASAISPAAVTAVDAVNAANAMATITAVDSTATSAPALTPIG